MANECKVFEMIAPRNRAMSLRVVPFLARTQLSTGGSVTLNKSTSMVTVTSSLAGNLTFEETDGTDPDGTVDPFPIAADTFYDFEVRPGTKIRFD